MATKKKTKEDQVIDITTPIKKHKLSLDFMKAYISEKDPDGKENFIANALDENTKLYNPKKARDYFCSKYPEIIIFPDKKKVKTATEKLLEW